MEVWMVIGYSDYEGNNECDGVFASKKDAVDHIIKIIADNWTVYGSDMVLGFVMKDEFIKKASEYILNDNETDYWYLWEDASEIWDKIFNGWSKNKRLLYRSWFGLKKTVIR